MCFLNALLSRREARLDCVRFTHILAAIVVPVQLMPARADARRTQLLLNRLNCKNYRHQKESCLRTEVEGTGRWHKVT